MITITIEIIVENNEKVEIVVPLKHLSNFWRTLDIPLINFETNLILTWSKNCVLTDKIPHAAVSAQEDNPATPSINALTNAAFKIADTKLYALLATLSI